jgi:uncharacterized membrane protein YtjA (UPF0391 family)
MLRWAILFLIVAIIAGVFGFPGITVAATDIARLLFVVFLVLFVIALFAARLGSITAMRLPHFPE